ncbi:MAG TPA: hypothetical protein VK440_04085 [Burkholderiales bacterium]|nr:hypothetical protein [Burkholderiales bacterium]
MRIERFLLAAGLIFPNASAFAYPCPMDMLKIDDARAANPTLSAEQSAEVKKRPARARHCTKRENAKNQ